MKRKEIMDDCPDDFKDKMGKILDYFEINFGEIRDKLDITKLSQLERVEDAYLTARDIADDLF